MDVTEVDQRSGEELRAQATDILREKGFTPDQLQITSELFDRMDEVHQAMRASPRVAEGAVRITDNAVQIPASNRGITAPSGLWTLKHLTTEAGLLSLASHLESGGPGAYLAHLRDDLARAYAAASDADLLPEGSPLRQVAAEYVRDRPAARVLERHGFSQGQVNQALEMLNLMDVVHAQMRASPQVSGGEWQLTDAQLIRPNTSTRARSGVFHRSHIALEEPEFTSYLEDGKPPKRYLNMLQEELVQTYDTARSTGLLAPDSPLHQQVSPFMPQPRQAETSSPGQASQS